jgi:peptide subunit release factor 1 (eRF1)
MTDHDLRRALAELCELRSDAEPIVSLYLDTSWTDEKQRERARVFVQESSKQAVDRHAAHPQLDALRRTLGRVARAASDRISRSDGAGRGLAVFACEALNLWRVLDVPQSFRCELCVDGRPHLLQLARLADDVEPALIAFVHGRGLQVYEVALGAVVNEATFEGPMPTRHGQGGRIRGGASPAPHGASGGAFYERADKNERHIEEVIEKTRREAAGFLQTLWERDPRTHLVLVGTSETVAGFENHLPERMRDRVLARMPRPPGKESWRANGQHKMLEEVVAKLAEKERKAEAEAVEHAIGEALRGGLAVLGPEDVVLAVNERRVHRLILEEDFERSGWRCRNCGALGMTHDEVCSFCQGPLARVDALGEELAGRVLANDGEVEVVGHTNRLHSYRGVAALLRQAKAKGLSGREQEAPRS